MALPTKPWSLGNTNSQEWSDWVTAALNQLIGQGKLPQGTGIQSLQNNTVNPTSSQIASEGSRTSSITTAVTFVATATTVSLFWDGTNGSQALQVARDDGTTFGPSIVGSPLVISGLVANTKYWIYAYFDESLQVVTAANVPGKSVGTPAVAFTNPNLVAAQQQILRGHVPLAMLLATSGITTPNAGSNTGSGGTGGGGAGAGLDRGALQ